MVVESKDDQVFRFWDDEASGKLVQAPLDLDRQGRGWCEVRRRSWVWVLYVVASACVCVGLCCCSPSRVGVVYSLSCPSWLPFS